MNLLELKTVLEKAFEGWSFDTPPSLEMGILTSNQAFKLAKNNKVYLSKGETAYGAGGLSSSLNPAEIAKELVPIIQEFLDKENLPLLAKAIGAYVNIDYKENFIANFLVNLNTPDTLLPRETETVLIDYFSPNVGKKMHVGHIRSADIGETLRRILSLKFKNVVSNNHLGDWGIQFGMIIWGLENIDKLDLNLDIEKLKDIKEKLDLKQEFDITWEEIEKYVKTLNQKEYIDILYQIYVRVNVLIEIDPEIKKASQDIIVKLAQILATNKYSGPDLLQASRIDLWYWLIIIISIFQYNLAEDYLNLNKNVVSSKTIDFQKIKDRLVQINALGAWKFNTLNGVYGFDVIIGESFYLTSQIIFADLIENGLAIKDPETQAIYVDLENEKLGRCYLISSEGYSLYHSRDIVARFIWAGVLEADIMLSLADNRQSHSFKQVFAVIKKIIDSKIYETKTFGHLTREETNKALQTLEKRLPDFIGFGFMTLPEGAMSTRKGKIIAFDELKEKIESQVKKVLSEKGGDNLNLDLVRKVSVASLKWADLHRDRDQDVVFDFNQFLSFEGNTGVYQLYTVARLNSILEKNRSGDDHIARVQDQVSPSNPLDMGNLDLKLQTSHLNADEILLLKQTTLLPLILEQITQNYKPHILSTHLFELATKVNSWYSRYSVSTETDLQRKAQLLGVVTYLKNYLWFGLELLGIEPVEKL